MRISALVFYAFCALLLLGHSSSPILAGNDIQVSRVVFVDYDGDGIDDLAADDNDNGIPDYIETKNHEPIVEVESVLGDAFAGSAPVNEDMYLNNAEAFGARDFSTRGLSSRRIGLNSDEQFGAGNGLSVGSAGGGCQGGACR